MPARIARANVPDLLVDLDSDSESMPARIARANVPDSDSESMPARIARANCPRECTGLRLRVQEKYIFPGLGVGVQCIRAGNSRGQFARAWTRSRSPVHSRGQFARAWTRSRSPGRPKGPVHSRGQFARAWTRSRSPGRPKDPHGAKRPSTRGVTAQNPNAMHIERIGGLVDLVEKQ